VPMSFVHPLLFYSYAAPFSLLFFHIHLPYDTSKYMKMSKYC
jgi:hypothetical protein